MFCSLINIIIVICRKQKPKLQLLRKESSLSMNDCLKPCSELMSWKLRFILFPCYLFIDNNLRVLAEISCIFQISCLRAEQTQLNRSLEKERQRAAENRQDYLAVKEEADTQLKQVIQVNLKKKSRNTGESTSRSYKMLLCTGNLCSRFCSFLCYSFKFCKSWFLVEFLFKDSLFYFFL